MFQKLANFIYQYLVSYDYFQTSRLLVLSLFLIYLQHFQMLYRRQKGSCHQQNCKYVCLVRKWKTYLNKYWKAGHLQSFTKYLKQTLAFMWNSAIREKFTRKFFIFLELLASIDKIFILAGRQGSNSSKFWDFKLSYVVPQLVKQLAYTMFITNNRALFQLGWKENLVKHQKVSKYYEIIVCKIFFCFLCFY